MLDSYAELGNYNMPVNCILQASEVNETLYRAFIIACECSYTHYESEHI